MPKFSILLFLLLIPVLQLQAQGDVLVSVTGTTPVSCYGGSDGTISVEVSGGVGEYTYLLVRSTFPAQSGGPLPGSTFTFTGHISYKGYLIIVSDEDDNTADGYAWADIGSPDSIEITNIAATDVTCSGYNDGSITVSATGESGSFIFDLAGPDPQNNETGVFTGLSPGTHTITVSDKNGCPTTEVSPPVIINNPPGMSVSINEIVDVDCYGDSTGAISITPSGGTPGGSGTGYTYEWTGPNGFISTAEDISNLKAGAYMLNVYDANMCMASLGPLNVVQPAELSVNLIGTTEVSCPGGSNGSAHITPGGGAGSYTFLWEGQLNGQTSTDEDPANLQADSYDLTLFDGRGCSKSFEALAVILQPDSITSSVISTTPVSCNGGNNGMAEVSVSGGTPAYNFTWSGSNSGYTSSFQNPTGMPADTFSLLVSDGHGCTQEFPDLIIITEPDPLAFSIDEITDVGCFSGSDGSATVTVSGGTTPYNIQWTGDVSGLISTEQNPINLVADSYDLVIIDDKGCSLIQDNALLINEPADISVSVDLVTPVNCFGEGTGAIGISPSGGTDPLTFAWAGPDDYTASSEDISDLEPGSYSLRITDAHGCFKDYSDLATVTSSTEIKADFILTDPLCINSADGAISTTVSGGQPNYIYSWVGASGFISGDMDLNGIVADTYTLTVTDALGCIKAFPPQELTGPDSIQVTTLLSHLSCFESGDGAIDLTAAERAGTLTYDWTGPNGFKAFTEDISGLEAGAYSVSITDENFCTEVFTDVAILTEPAEILILELAKEDNLCHGDSLGSIEVASTSGGVAPLRYSINGGADYQSGASFGQLPAGNYQVLIIDATGCMSQIQLVEITQPASPLGIITYIQEDITSCSDAAEGEITITVTGGTGIIGYTLDGGPNNPSGFFQNIPAGQHDISATDQNGCSLDTTGEILAPLPLVVDTLTLTNVSGCWDDANGEILISGSGGTGFITYAIDRGPFLATGSFTGLQAGSYLMSLRDDNLCTLDSMVTLTAPEPVTASIEVSDISYGALGSITFSDPAGGTPPYEYSIDGASGTFSQETSYPDLEAGNYDVAVRDANGCLYEQSVQIRDIIPMSVTLNITHVSCFGYADGSIEFLPTDAEGDVSYSIDGGSSFVSESLFENLPGGSTYNLVAIDTAGKVFIDFVEIIEPAELMLSWTSSPAECDAFSETGSIIVNVSGGTPLYTFLWSDGDNSEDRSDLMAGEHVLQTTDAMGCSRSDTMIVNALVIVEADAGMDTTICEGTSLQLNGSGTGLASWSNPEFLSDPDILDPLVTGLGEETSFILTISEESSPFGCFDQDTVTIGVYPSTGITVSKDTFVVKGQSVPLEAFGGPFSSYRWVPETGLDNPMASATNASPQENTMYTVYGTNEYNCEESASVLVEVIESIRAYNVFTPGSDGYNDFFEIENAERFPDILIEVYSRWGDLLYSSKGYDEGNLWDGYTRGTKVPTGTYYYVIIPYRGAKPITGNVTVIWSDE